MSHGADDDADGGGADVLHTRHACTHAPMPHRAVVMATEGPHRSPALLRRSDTAKEERRSAVSCAGGRACYGTCAARVHFKWARAHNRELPALDLMHRDLTLRCAGVGAAVAMVCRCAVVPVLARRVSRHSVAVTSSPVL